MNNGQQQQQQQHGSGQGISNIWGNFAGQTKNALNQIMVKKYTLPDKTVASQVLMYRQLLHTKCRPSLKLSRPYQATVAQKSVKHMPWWARTKSDDDGRWLDMEETKLMVISYDNLIHRLWNSVQQQKQKQHDASTTDTVDNTTDNTTDTGNNTDTIPPTMTIPHDDWVKKFGFQQRDPVTDFRSGGVLSLALMVYIVESCPQVYARYQRCSCSSKSGSGGDASVLPFGITSINVTDMISKFLMLSKNTDRMDALLSQKPFWYMFSDPNAILACQELALDMLADVVVEIRTVRQQELQLAAAANNKNNNDSSNSSSHEHETTIEEEELVTVFDFAHILSVTEQRVEYDLLGAGPRSVVELRVIHQRICKKYQLQLQNKLEKLRNNNKTTENNNNELGIAVDEARETAKASTTTTINESSDQSNNSRQQRQKKYIHDNPFEKIGVVATGLAGNVGSVASGLAGNVMSVMKKAPSSSPAGNNNRANDDDNNTESMEFAYPATATTTTTTTDDTTQPITSSSSLSSPPTTNLFQDSAPVDPLDDSAAASSSIEQQVSQFSIDDDDDLL